MSGREWGRGGPRLNHSLRGRAEVVGQLPLGDLRALDSPSEPFLESSLCLCWTGLWKPPILQMGTLRP